MDQNSANQQPVEESSKDGRQGGACPRAVVVVDDDLEIREALAMMIHEQGYMVRTAVDGQDALNLLKDLENPGLIFLDLTMPVMDGESLLSVLDGDRRLSSIPVVILTAMPERAISSSARVLRKPVDFDLVLDLVERYCGAFAA